MTIAPAPRRILLRSILLGLWWVCGVVPASYAADSLHVLVVTGDVNPLYQRFVSAFKQDLPPSIQVTLIERVEDFSVSSQKADLILSVGIKSAEWVAGRTSIPMLAAMVPRNGTTKIFATRPGDAQTSAIFLDQPWARQVALLRAALPDRARVGVLHSPASAIDIGELRRQLARRGATLIETQHTATELLFDDLDELLSRCDVLLALPDGRLFNGANIRNILLSSYNRGVPLVGFSEAFVKAGALVAVFSTPEQLAVQARTAAIAYARLRQLPAPQAPTLFSIAVNQEVARSLGIAVRTAEALRALIEPAKPAEPSQ